MSGIEDIPLIGGIAETAIHGVEAVGDAVQGDWDGAAHEAYGMAGAAVHTVADDLTGGVFGVAEHVYDAAAPGLGLPTSDDISHTIEHGVQDVGNALGDGAYNLVHGAEGGLGDLGDLGGLGDLGSQSDASADQGDPYGGMDGGADGGMDAGMGDMGDMGGDGGF